MKRKPSAADIYDDDSSSSSDASTIAFSPRRRKRVKYTSLERGLAHMTLNAPVTQADPLSPPTVPEDVDIIPSKASSSSPHLSRSQNHLNVILPSSIEEPPSPPSDSESVDMEIDPELITSDISPAARLSCTADDWDGAESGPPDVKEVQISSAVLERLREQTRRPHSLIPLPSQTSRALVLYRPPELPSPKHFGDVYEEQPDQEEQLPRETSLEASEGDAMDVE